MDKHILFQKVNDCLTRDDAPSLQLREFERREWLRDYPFSMLAELRNTEQSPVHHPEGNVWNHTLLVVDEAAKYRRFSGNERAFMWAALLHDIGKPKNTRVRKGKITAYDHDKAGAELAKQFLLALTDETDFMKAVVMLVRYHMQILFVVNGLPYQDIPGMREHGGIPDVALLGYCDRLGRTGADIRAEQDNILRFLEKCGERTNVLWLKRE